MTTPLRRLSATTGRAGLDDDVDPARDRALVLRAQAGDRSAFDDLYLRYYRRLYRFCLRRLNDVHEAEDVAQETFTRAWKALPRFGGDRRFYPWLTVIAANRCTDVVRRRVRSTPVAELDQRAVASAQDDGEDLMMAAVDSALVTEAFGRLSDRHRRILELREGSGWSYQRIADHEGVGISAVETLLWRARQALKREFSAVTGPSGTGALAGAGLASLATLRAVLRLPARCVRRVAAGGSRAAFALGSAAAAAALITSATVGSAPGPVPGAGATGTGGAVTTGGRSAPASHPRARGGDRPGVGAAGAGPQDGNPSSDQAGGAAPTTTPGPVTSAGPVTTPGATVPGLGTAPGSTVAGAETNAAAAARSLGTSVAGTLASGLDSLTSGLGTLATGLGTDAGSTLDQLGTTTGQVGQQAGQIVTSVAGAATGTASTVLGTVSGGSTGSTATSTGTAVAGTAASVGSTVGSTTKKVTGALGSTITGALGGR